MKWLRKKKNKPQPFSAKTNTTLAQVLATHDLVEVVKNDGDPFVIVSERSKSSSGFNDGTISYAENYNGSTSKPAERGNYALDDSVSQRSNDVVDLYEIGSSAPSPFTSFIRREYNRDLIGIKGLEKYDQMRRSDGVVRGTLRAIKTPVLAGRWFIKPNDVTKVADVNAADFVWKNLTEYMSISWSQFLQEALLMCDFGYYMFEIVWVEDVFEGQQRLMVQKLAPRHPMDVKTWIYDNNGGPAGVVMYPPSYETYEDVFIPIDKLIVFTFDREAGNIEGLSVLRSAYKHWYYKDQLYKIDAIQKERHGIGIPIIKLPPGFSPADKSAANQLGRNLRTNERAHVVLPPNWELLFAKLEGHVVNALESIKVHDAAIRENVLAGFLGSETMTNTDDQIMFLKATRFIADTACDVINKHLIPKMIDANFQRVGNPVLKARRIGEQQDWRTLSFALRNLVGANLLRPDDKLEEFIRDEMDLPEMDIKTLRTTGDVTETVTGVPGPNGTVVAAPTPGGPATANSGIITTKQAGQKVGLPRQGPPPTGVQNKTSGVDKSGGK